MYRFVGWLIMSTIFLMLGAILYLIKACIKLARKHND